MRDTALYRWLAQKNVSYAGKVVELREEAEGWLSYIPATFPHYTRHTVKHSDEIVCQLSKLLFRNESPDELVVPHLSATEAYICIASAYLHDAGMVASDKEKEEILTSEGFRDWLEASAAWRERWKAIENLRCGDEPQDSVLRHFIADRQVRFVLAEYIRGRHHLRSGNLVTLFESELGRIGFGDPGLTRIIQNVCISHGLQSHELEDHERYPESRDVRGDKVNVRFVATLVRLGDLLDLSSSRACPILLNAACPLPQGSYPHWTQYKMLEKDVSPDKIEIVAKCENAEEHRILRDWCEWIVDEVNSGRRLMAHSTRHRDWVAPRATSGSGDSTIRIERAPGSKYLPVDWKFEFDETSILERLIRDVYDNRLAFVRELVQNALDATRCQAYEEWSKEGRHAPASPTQLSDSFRRRFPIAIRLIERDAQNALSGGIERKQVVVLNDFGLGMDRETIQRHLLQIGRSYYSTEDFRRRFHFVPTSRFGIGFLSVFGESDRVEIETYRPSSPDGPLRLILNGPRTYILVEESRRAQPGTEIQIVLREPLKPGELTSFVRSLCVRVEFPVHVDELGNQTVIVGEDSRQYECEVPDLEDPTLTYFVKGYDVRGDGVEGELYVVGARRDGIEYWDWTTYKEFNLIERRPSWNPPPSPGSVLCFHGLTLESTRPGFGSQEARSFQRIDLRGVKDVPALGRQQLQSEPHWHRVIAEHWDELLHQHIRRRTELGVPADWKYLQRLALLYPFSSWDQVEWTWPTRIGPDLRAISFAEALGCERWGLLFEAKPREDLRLQAATAMDGLPIVSKLDMRDCADKLIERFFASLYVEGFGCGRGGNEVLLLRRGDKRGGFEEFVDYAAFAGPSIVSRRIGIGHSYRFFIVFNTANPFVSWWLRLKASSEVDRKLTIPFTALSRLMIESARFPSSYLGRLTAAIEGWRVANEIADAYRPPTLELSTKNFWTDS